MGDDGVDVEHNTFEQQDAPDWHRQFMTFYRMVQQQYTAADGSGSDSASLLPSRALAAGAGSRHRPPAASDAGPAAQPCDSYNSGHSDCITALFADMQEEFCQHRAAAAAAATAFMAAEGLYKGSDDGNAVDVDRMVLGSSYCRATPSSSHHQDYPTSSFRQLSQRDIVKLRRQLLQRANPVGVADADLDVEMLESLQLGMCAAAAAVNVKAAAAGGDAAATGPLEQALAALGALTANAAAAAEEEASIEEKAKSRNLNTPASGSGSRHNSARGPHQHHLQQHSAQRKHLKAAGGSAEHDVAAPSAFLPHSTGGIFDLPSYACGGSDYGSGGQDEPPDAPYLTFQSPSWPLAATELGLLVLERMELQRLMREQLQRRKAARATVQSLKLQAAWLRATAPFRSHHNLVAAQQQVAASEAHARKEARQAAKNLSGLALLLQVKEQQLHQLAPSNSGEKRLTSAGGCQPLEARAAGHQAVTCSSIDPLAHNARDAVVVLQENRQQSQGTSFSWLDKYVKNRGIATLHQT
eukprot:gene10752-10908_t